MAIVPLPLPPSAEARALLHHLLEHGDIVGRDPESAPPGTVHGAQSVIDPRPQLHLWLRPLSNLLLFFWEGENDGCQCGAGMAAIFEPWLVSNRR